MLQQLEITIKFILLTCTEVVYAFSTLRNPPALLQEGFDGILNKEIRAKTD